MINGADVKTPRDYIDSSLTSIRLLKANKSIKFVVCIPSYEVLTSDSRKVLPDKYTRNDVVFNIGRASTLVAALIDSNVDAEIISLCMQDRIHQQYRACLVPGLDVVLKQKPKDIQGLLGVCLSGAGPTVLALANNNFDKIGEHFVDIFSRHRDADGKSVECIYQVLEVDYTGSIVTIN
jgi:homoserine kinase